MNVPPPVHTPLVLLQRCSFGLSPTHRGTVRPSTPSWLLELRFSLLLPPHRARVHLGFIWAQPESERGRERERKSEGPLCSDGSMSSEEASQEGRRCCCGCCCRRRCCSRQTYFSRKRKLLSPCFLESWLSRRLQRPPPPPLSQIGPTYVRGRRRLTEGGEPPTAHSQYCAHILQCSTEGEGGKGGSVYK